MARSVAGVHDELAVKLVCKSPKIEVNPLAYESSCYRKRYKQTPCVNMHVLIERYNKGDSDNMQSRYGTTAKKNSPLEVALSRALILFSQR